MAEGKIAIYSRKSRFTGKGESIGNQIGLCREYVRTVLGEEASCCAVFEDEGFSGGSLKRPAFQKMMEGVRRQEFRAIIVYRLDRISRSISDFAALIQELNQRGVAFVSVREQFDTGTPMGRAMMFIISVFSQLERETIAERIRDNMRELAKTGRWLGGNTPLGYRSQSISQITLDGKRRSACRLELIPEEGELVKLIFRLYGEMDSLTATEYELLRRGIKTRKGKDFTRFAIKGILKNPVYMIGDEAARRYFSERVEVCAKAAAFDGVHGMMAYNRTEQKKGSSTVELPMEEWILSVGKHPGLIPGRQWIAVQQSLERNKSTACRKPRTNSALLTGLLFCSCGGRMYPKLTKSGAYSYVCKRKERSRKEQCAAANADGILLDRAVLEQIKELPEDRSELLRRLCSGRQFCAGEMEGALELLRKARGENERKIRGLTEAIAMTEDGEAKSRMIYHMEELFRTNQELDRREEEREKLSPAELLPEDELRRLVEKLLQLPCVVEEMSLEEKRAAVRELIQRVVWDGNCAHVVLTGAEGVGMPWGEDSK